MRPSRVLLSFLVLSSCVGIGLLPCFNGACRAQVYGVLPTSYYVPSYYATAYYPSSYYSTAYYPTYYSSAYYPTNYSSAYYPTYYSSAYYPTYYSSAYYPTYYSSAYYPTDYSSAYYPTYYSSAYYPTYYSSAYYYPTYYPSSYYYPTYYPSSYYYPTTYYSTGYYLGKSDNDRETALADTRVATTNRRRTLNDLRRLVDRPVVARNGTTQDLTNYQSTPNVVVSDTPTAPNSALVRRTTYVAATGTLRDETQTPPVVSKTPPAAGSGKPVGAGAGARPDATKSGGADPAKKRTPEVAPPRQDSEPALEPAPPIDGAPQRRESLRPRYQTLTTPNVLVGRVESDSGEAREGVRVTVSSRTEPGLARAGLSNAFGRFAIRLGDGDWTVRVTMPSGRVYAVRQITVQNGRVVDDQEGRDIPNLIISY